MNENNDRIIFEYQAADFNRRLHMYLRYPRLRSEFILIDLDNLNTDLPAALKLRKNSLAAQMREAFGSVSASVKKILGIASA